MCMYDVSALNMPQRMGVVALQRGGTCTPTTGMREVPERTGGLKNWILHLFFAFMYLYIII